MSLKRFKSFVVIFLLSTNHLFGDELVYTFDSPVISEYMKIQNQFNSQFCTTDLEKKYFELFKDYRGEGYFVPFVEEKNGNMTIDLNSLRLRLPLVQQKMSWLDSQIEMINKLNSLPDEKTITATLKKQVDELLSLKKAFFHLKSFDKRKQLSAKSHALMKKFTNEYNNFLKKIPFLLSFNSPVDYAQLRMEYEGFKNSKDKITQQKANAIFLKRKILEDGALDLDNTRPDVSLRAILDTLYIRLNRDLEFIPEDVRYDFDFALKQVKKYLALSKNTHLERLTAWKIRAENEYNFYIKLLHDSQGSKVEQQHIEEMVKKRSVAKSILKDFILKREAQAYTFWSQQSELHQAMFVIQTILINEVGEVDGRSGLERRDVTQVVINRHNLDFYSMLTTKDSILGYLGNLKNEQIEKSRWLNVMFKEGEFSFTYYFIPASIKIFCPDQSKMAKNLLLENLNIALELLKNPNGGFLAVRYFSRASMIGRIDMAPMWSDHEPIAERAGVQLVAPENVLQQIKKGNFHYFYTFTDPWDVLFDVVEVNDRTYVVSNSPNKKVYSYRNPNLFTYFVKKNGQIPARPLPKVIP